MEVAYLILIGELPTAKQLEEFTGNIRYHTMINETLLRFFNGFHHNAHPMPRDFTQARTLFSAMLVTTAGERLPIAEYSSTRSS